MPGREGDAATSWPDVHRHRHTLLLELADADDRLEPPATGHRQLAAGVKPVSG
jgi:hypothetical protein